MNEKKYIPTIGLEIHAELATETKMFCRCKNDPDEKEPNVNICPVCMAHPGTLPVINKKAVENILKVGVAVGGKLADFTEFDRKNYFYPDIPKGYQISQYKYPLVSGGSINGVEITRIHLEEDTARSTHHGEYSLVDYNRAGVPLMEMVTEPVIHSAEDAGAFARELQLLLQTLGASEANMEKGEMRIEVNISIAEEGGRGTKVEVKNINSFRAAERAVLYEMERQAKVLESGEKVIQETRGWDDTKQSTYSQRAKEDSHDYRYFPDPDLPKLYLSEVPEFAKEILQKALPELPWVKRERYKTLGLGPDQIELFVSDPRFNALFEGVINDGEFKSAAGSIPLLANYISSDIAGLVSKFGELGLKNITPRGMGALVIHLSTGEISSRGAKDTLAEVFEKGGSIEEVVKRFLQKSDKEELRAIVKEVITEQGAIVAEYKAGKESTLQFLVGQSMKKTKGAGNPQVLAELLKEELSK